MQVVLLYIGPTEEVTRPYGVCMYFKFIIIKMNWESNENENKMEQRKVDR